MKSSTFLSSLLLALTVSASPVVKRQEDPAAPAPAPAPSSADGAVASASQMVPTASSSASAPTPTETGAPANATEPTTGALNDTQILQFALTLEHLENAFYNTSIGQFSDDDFQQAGFNSTTRDQIYSIGQDEAAHVAFLTAALGDSAVSPCEYDLSSVTDVQSFLATAQVLEGVGVSAYLGAAKLIMDKTYLEAAGSILTVEARHQSYINAQVNSSGNAIPGAFDTPLNATQVYSLAAPFIKSCPDNSTLPFKAFPVATITSASASSASSNSTGASNSTDTESADGSDSTDSMPMDISDATNSTAPVDGSSSDNSTAPVNGTASDNSTSSASDSVSTAIVPGSQVTIKYDNSMTQSQDGQNASTRYVAIISGPTAPTFVELPEDGTITLPANITGGQFYAVITSSNENVSDDTALAIGAGQVVVPLPKAPAATASSAASSASATSDMGMSASSAVSGVSSAEATVAPTSTASTSASGATASATSSVESGVESVSSAVESAVPSAATSA